MPTPGVYAFDEADAELSLMPMAARRALDVAGRHLSLEAWATLAREQRVRLIALGAAESIDAAEVARLLDGAGVPTRVEPARPDPDAQRVPGEVASLLDAARPLDAAQWQALRALDRYVLFKLGSRGKRERLEAAYDEIVASPRR